MSLLSGRSPADGRDRIPAAGEFLSLSAGARLGPYEILSPLGAGGMGEVYRARDARLDRFVAVKVLPASLAGNPDSLARFEREARAVAALSHPNILGIFDFGRDDGIVYAVMELLEGESLRDRLTSGLMPLRKAVELAAQIARGLAAAHDRGIVHRDLKPENVFLTSDGHVKILDFGLALEVPALDADRTTTPTISRPTDPGTVLGTVGYMSPEHVRGKTADQRSDIFSFGCVLYEMISGERAFVGDSAAETMAAIAQLEPPELAISGSAMAPALDRIVGHCLEKRPEDRFQSARDIAFDLEMSLGLSTTSAGHARLPAPPARARLLLMAAASVLVMVLAAGAFIAGRRAGRGTSGELRFTPLSFRREPIFNARFASDGQTVVFSSAPAGNVPKIFALRPGSPGAAALGVADTHLLAASSQGELAVLTRARYIGHRLFEGTLARMPLDGGAPREILDGVREADWAPDGSGLAIVRDVGGKDRLEYPVGKVLREIGGYVSDLRFSPQGDRIAFFEHPIKWDNRGLVAVVDLAGRRTVLSDGYSGEEGLAWSADGKEVFFSAGIASDNVNAYAVDLRARRRVLVRGPGDVTIQDAAGGVRWLLTRNDISREMPVVTSSGDEKDLSWLDLSDPVALSPDGATLLFTESSGSLGVNYAVCLRGTDGSPVVRLGEGQAQDLSRDGKWALAVVPSSPQQLVIYPTGPGEIRRLDRGALASFESARFAPDGSSVLACGHEEKHAVRCYLQSVSGSPPRAVTPEGTTDGFVSPDGRTVLVRSGRQGLMVYPLSGGAPRAVPATTADDRVILWKGDDSSIFVGKTSELPAPIERLDLSSGARTLVRRLGAAGRAGVLQIGKVVISENESVFAYSARSMVSRLYRVEGGR